MPVTGPGKKGHWAFVLWGDRKGFLLIICLVCQSSKVNPCEFLPWTCGTESCRALNCPPAAPQSHTHFCWSFMVSMTLLSSRTCVLSSSKAAWLLVAGSVFGFPSTLNRDGELALCPAVPKEDSGDGAAATRGAGPLLAAMLPGLGGSAVLLSDTWKREDREGSGFWLGTLGLSLPHVPLIS